MKEISLNVENYNEHLFHYPCINPIGKYLENKIVWVLNDNESNTKYLRSIVEAGAKIENILEIDLLCSVFTPEIAIVFPPKQLTDNVPSGDTQEEYYRIMEHYIHFSQMMVHRMSDQPTTFNHLLFVSFSVTGCPFFYCANGYEFWFREGWVRCMLLEVYL